MSRSPNNGATFSKKPYAKPRSKTDADLGAYYLRRASEQRELEASCAKTREFNQLIRTDFRAALEAIGLPVIPAPAPIKRRI
jgi:hypothetical protein